MKTLITVLLALTLPGCASRVSLDPADAPKSEPAHSVAAAAPKEVPKNKIPVILIEGSEKSTIAFTEQSEDPIRTAAVDEITEIARQYAAANKPVVLAIDASRVRERKYLAAPAKKPVKKQIDLERKPNPALQRAQEAVRAAEARVRSAESSDQDAQKQAMELAKDPNLNRWGALAAGLGAIALGQTSGVSGARQDLEEATTKLQETPPTIEVPVYQTVMTPVASLVTEKTGEIIAFVIDVPSQSARTVRIPVQHETRSEFAYDPSVGDDATIPTGTSAPASHQVSISQILKQAAQLPNVALADAVSSLKTDRETFIAATSEVDRKRSETTANTLAQLTGTSKPKGKEKTQELAAAKVAPPASSASAGASAAGSATASGGGSDNGNGSATGQCPKDTSSLAKKVKPTGLPRIDERLKRGAAIDIAAAMRDATKEGYTPSSAVQASLETARAMKKTAAEAARAAGQAFGRPGYSDDEFLAQLNEGTLAPQSCEGAESVCNAIAMRTEAIANGMVASAMACHEKQGTWPK